MPHKHRATRPEPQHEAQPHPGELGLERIVFFSDAVIAIAITLLAIDLRVPEVAAAAAAGELPRRLAQSTPQFVSFAISFFVIGVYWSGHHRYFKHIRRYDTGLIVLNLLFLFFIALMPFVSGLLGHYPLLPLSLAIYAGAVAATGYAIAAVWWYASHRYRLIDPDLPVGYIRYTNLVAVVVPTFFLLSIPFASLSPYATVAVWWGGPLVFRVAMLLAIRRRIRAGYAAPWRF